ncbi:MAG TPA: hypothetical protein VHO90_16000, partial [Bacteroidales bacterium]|nr:hypothetical protein [Bacteroidales bacterium]
MKRLSSFIAIAFIAFAFFSCKKEKELTLPEIKTTFVRAVGSSSLQVTGEVVSDGNSFVVTNGICWSDKQVPTIADDTIISGEGLGSFVGYVKKTKKQHQILLQSICNESCRDELRGGYGSHHDRKDRGCGWKHLQYCAHRKSVVDVGESEI